MMEEKIDRCSSCRFFDKDGRFGRCRNANAERFGQMIPGILPRCNEYKE